MANFDNVNRVFILGAGFSKAVGMPLSNELTRKLVDTVFTREDPRDDGDFWWWLRDISERIKRITNISTTQLLYPDFEQFFECAKFDIEYYRMQHKESKANRILCWIQQLENKLVGVLTKDQQHANIGAIKNFSESLEQGDVVLTFNYDSILETSLSVINKCWNHGFTLENAVDSSIPILKLHGSIDWWQASHGHALDNAIKLFEKKDVIHQQNIDIADTGIEQGYEFDEILYRVFDIGEVNKCFVEFIGENDFIKPGIAGLGSYKPLHKLVGSGVVWRNANFAIKSTKEIYIIGWSASPFDTMARFYFNSMLNQREIPPSRIVVVDPNVGDGENYKAVFGEVIPVEKRVEEVDWDELLAPLTI